MILERERPLLRQTVVSKNGMDGFPRVWTNRQDAVSCTLAGAPAGLRSGTARNGATDDAAEMETEENTLMRSDLIFGALTHVENRYQLCQLASKATRKLHKPNTRLQDTTNEVLDRFKDTVPMDDAGEPPVEKVYVDSDPTQERRAA